MSVVSGSPCSVDFSVNEVGNKSTIGLVNSGITCYANCILQVLHVLPELTGNIQLEDVLPLVDSLFGVFYIMDNSNLLCENRVAFMNQLGSSLAINVHEQQDVVDILQSFLNLLVTDNVIDNESLQMTLQQTIECSECNNISSTVQKNKHCACADNANCAVISSDVF